MGRVELTIVAQIEPSVTAHARTGSIRHNRAGHAFNQSETAPTNTENGREWPEHQRGGGSLSPGTAPCYRFDHSTRRTNRGRETMRDDPWTAANRDQEQRKVTIPPRRKPTAETPGAPSKPTISGPFWTGKKICTRS